MFSRWPRRRQSAGLPLQRRRPADGRPDARRTLLTIAPAIMEIPGAVNFLDSLSPTGNQAAMTHGIFKAGRRMSDPLTGRFGMSGAGSAAITNALFSELYAGDNYMSMPLKSGAFGSMVDELQTRGMGPTLMSGRGAPLQPPAGHLRQRGRPGRRHLPDHRRRSRQALAAVQVGPVECSRRLRRDGPLRLQEVGRQAQRMGWGGRRDERDLRRRRQPEHPRWLNCWKASTS